MLADDPALSIPEPPARRRPRPGEGLPEWFEGPTNSRLARGRAFLASSRAYARKVHLEGAPGAEVSEILSEAADRLLGGLYAELAASHASLAECCLLALGGYGRSDLSLGSDVDLLLLASGGLEDGRLEAAAGEFHTLAWDLGLTVGWSVRTAGECVRAAEEDHTVRTALLDCRYVAGSRGLWAEFLRAGVRELVGSHAERFIRDKVRELADRRVRYLHTVFLLEPNVKQGEGGLRDLEAALWIAKVRFCANDLHELLLRSIVTPGDERDLGHARDFLRRIRHHLHFSAGRKEDRLTFALQEEVARFLGYRDGDGGRLGVEQFMRHYYLAASCLRRLADDLVARCEELSSAPERKNPERRMGPFKVFNGRLSLAQDGELLKQTPALAIRLFRVADEEGLPLYSWAKEQVKRCLPQLEAACGRAEVASEIRALFGRPGTSGGFLEELRECGALEAIFPELVPIVGLRVHDLYHVYTVDVHSQLAVRRLYALRNGELAAEEPELSRVMRDLDRPLAVYLAALFHDVGKGRGDSHAELGAEIVDRVAKRIELSEEEGHLAQFLVRNHLVMSKTAQHRDLSDPELIRLFAKEVVNAERLSALYVLTYADMASVGPGVWNDWKRQLLSTLYAKAQKEIVGPPEEGHWSEGGGGRAEFVRRWSEAFGAPAAERLGRVLPDRYFLQADVRLASRHARLLLRAERVALATFWSKEARATRGLLSLAARDRPGLLAAVAGVLAAHSLEILSASVFSTSDGFALDSFGIQGPEGGRKRWRAARSDLFRVLEGTLTVEDVIRRRRPNALFLRSLPSVRTEVSLDNRASRSLTVVDVVTGDRMGLLYTLASTLRDAGVDVALARVATEGHRAVDSFYVSRNGKKIADGKDAEELARVIATAVDRAER